MLKYKLKSGRAADAEIKEYTVKDMENYLTKTYCSSVGYEYTHLNKKSERDFFKSLVEQHIESL